MKKLNKKGFTIVELVIVIAVIAILAGVLIPTFSGVISKANESKAMQETRNAYTEYLASQNMVTFNMEDADYEITNGTYKFYVVNGQWMGTTTDSSVSYTAMKIENGAMTEVVGG